MSSSIRDISYSLPLKTNVSWTFLGNVFNAGSWFAMTIVLAKLGSPEDVGKFALGLAATAPVFMFATLRLRDVQATDAKQEFLFEDYFALRIITTLLALIIVGGIVFFTDFVTEMSMIIIAMGFSKAIEAISDAFYGFFMQKERMDHIGKSLMMKGPLSLLGLTLGFYFTGSVFWGVVGLAIGRLIIMITHDARKVGMIFNSASTQLNIFKLNIPLPRWNHQILSRLFWVALPLGFVTMLISFNTNIPRYFIEGHLGSYQLGIFAAVASFQKVAPTVIQALGRSSAARLSKYFVEKKIKAFQNLGVKLIFIVLFLGIMGVLVAFFAGKQILTLFYGSEYALYDLFALIMLAAGINYISTILLFIITSARFFRIQLPLHLLNTASIALACYFLIPSLGLLGAAYALIIGALFLLCGSLAATWLVFRDIRRI